MTRIVLIDNHDSFTHLLADLIDAAVGVYPDIIDRDADITSLMNSTTPASPPREGAAHSCAAHGEAAVDCFVISPGPGHPADELPAARAALASGVPVLGVCLGHQLIAYEAGGTVDVARHPMHGRSSEITYRGRRVQVARYHSLEVLPDNPAASIPTLDSIDLQVLGYADDGTIMAFKHRHKPQVGLQFHPESYGTEDGAWILADALCEAMAIDSWAERYPYFARLDFEGHTRFAAGHHRAMGPADDSRDLPIVGAMHYEATGLQDGSTDVDPSRSAMFFAEQFLTVPSLQAAEGTPSPGTHAPITQEESPEQSANESASVDATLTAKAHQWLPLIEGWEITTPTLADTVATYCDKVLRAQEYIRQGESYELCLTTHATAQIRPCAAQFTTHAPEAAELYHGTPAPLPRSTCLALYRRLQEQTPAPMSGLLITPDTVILSASPERFVDAHNGYIRAQPIKGTRPRGVTAEDDQRLVHELKTSTKDRAENLMIVDVLRNDLHRSCVRHSITVPEFAVVKTYPRVHQLVSTISGELRDAPAIAALKAYPGGSMTGAPKQRSMELLQHLEGRQRGFYSGILGYVDGEDMDFNMLIRSIVITAHPAKESATPTISATYGAGGAVTRLSDPQEEFDEVLVKMRPFAAWCGAEPTLPTASAAPSTHPTRPARPCGT